MPLEAPSTEAVDMNHAKLNCRCDWITEVSYDLLSDIMSSMNALIFPSTAEESIGGNIHLQSFPLFVIV